MEWRRCAAPRMPCVFACAPFARPSFSRSCPPQRSSRQLCRREMAEADCAWDGEWKDRGRRERTTAASGRSRRQCRCSSRISPLRGAFPSSSCSALSGRLLLVPASKCVEPTLCDHRTANCAAIRVRTLPLPLPHSFSLLRAVFVQEFVSIVLAAALLRINILGDSP